MLRSPQPIHGGFQNPNGPMKAMNRTITHNEPHRNMGYDDIHSGNTATGYSSHNKNAQHLHPISEHDHPQMAQSKYDSQIGHGKYPQPPQMRKGKSTRRDNKTTNNGSMVLIMSNLMTKRSQGGKSTKRPKNAKPQSETGNGKNYH